MGPLIPRFWTSGDVPSGFQQQSGPPRLHVLSPMRNGFLRFTSGATSADLMMAVKIRNLELILNRKNSNGIPPRRQLKFAKQPERQANWNFFSVLGTKNLILTYPGIN